MTDRQGLWQRVRPRSVYEVMGAVAFVAVLLGGSAYAAVVVSSNAEIAANTISGSKKPAGYANDNIVNNSVDQSDLAPNGRAHRLEFTAAPNPSLSPVTLATVDNVRISAACFYELSNGYLWVYAQNLTNDTGAINTMSTVQSQSDGSTTTFVSGEYIAGGETHSIDGTDSGGTDVPLAYGSTFSRVEGQTVFETPGKVTTIQFHAFVNTSICQFFGTAVTAKRA